jgi:hypothetical protein
VLFAAALLQSCANAPAAEAPSSETESMASAACVVAGPEVCFNAWDDNCNGAIDEGCGVDGGLVQFAIAWESKGADVDLDVRDPTGALVEVGRTAPSGLTRDRDCPGKDDGCGRLRYENVYLTDDSKLMRGNYRVTIRLEHAANWDDHVEVSLSARLVNRQFRKRVRLEHDNDAAEFTLSL